MGTGSSDPSVARDQVPVPVIRFHATLLVSVVAAGR